MQYDVSTPEEYLAQLESDWRRDTLHELRQIILSEGPDLQESISYGMLTYSTVDESLFRLNAQKNYVSLYVEDIEKVDAGGSLLEGLNLGKGCIRFSKTSGVDDRISEFVRRAIDMNISGEQSGGSIATI